MSEAIKKAITMLETYYGPYENDFVRQIVSKHLANYQEEKLPALVTWIFERHEKRFFTPGVAAIKRQHEQYAKDTGDSLLVVSRSACSPVAPDGPPVTQEERLDVLDDLEHRDGPKVAEWFKRLVVDGVDQGRKGSEWNER